MIEKMLLKNFLFFISIREILHLRYSFDSGAKNVNPKSGLVGILLTQKRQKIFRRHIGQQLKLLCILSEANPGEGQNP
ncbi:hypothetical protein ACAD32_02195 [Clavibacter nebraskensis]